MNQILCDPAIPSKKWWGIVKSMCYSAIPAICKREDFISFQKKIVNALDDFLMSQATSVPNNDSAEIPFVTFYLLLTFHFISAWTISECLEICKCFAVTLFSYKNIFIRISRLKCAKF